MTPEAKLLELIRKTPSAKRSPVFAAAQARLRTVNVLRRLSKRGQVFFSSFRRVSGLQMINRLLIGASAIGLLCLVAGLLTSFRTPDALSAPVLHGRVETGKDRSLLHAIQLTDLTRRNVFRPLIAPAPPARKIVKAVALPPPPPPKPPLSQRLSYLKLVGIMNTTPLQAIVEDQKNQKTLYLSAGQPVDDAQVEKVLNDKVIFISGDDRYSLTM